MTIIDYVHRGTLEDTELIDGLVFNQRTAGSGGPTRIDKAKIGLIQFCISPPKTDVCTVSSFMYVCLMNAFMFYEQLHS